MRKLLQALAGLVLFWFRHNFDARGGTGRERIALQEVAD